ncbi:MAG TPA: TetR/AcrR family transcriptional regulator, partial [Rhodothermales bacterium]|nr:TetR/AcrR family transcriptional regulator [Rhodothermales bacterium]
MARTSGTNLRREILDTTRRLLIQDGYQNLSMRKIANAIGYSATSIYLYFENKDNLVHALIDEGMEKMQQLLLGIDNLLTDPLKALRELCNRYVAFGLENPEYYEVMFQLHPARMARYPVEKYR